jgi:hypothetical protein
LSTKQPIADVSPAHSNHHSSRRQAGPIVILSSTPHNQRTPLSKKSVDFIKKFSSLCREEQGCNKTIIAVLNRVVGRLLVDREVL